MIKIEQLQEKEIYLFKITDDIDQAGAEKFINFLASKADNNEKIKLIGEVRSMPGFESFKAFTETMKLKVKAMGVIEKYAILSNKHWLENIIPIANFLTPTLPIKYFELNERDAAIAWLKQTEKKD
ncbi:MULTISPECIES: SpoIIAA family protein [Bizionia]|uniref:STAS/SEC14 domain-containing protein n=1 Tax=Bizionia algoritergicola TaxID=291187 RepID=A0A5D0QZC9_9FLAO|nr:MULTISPECIES: STAS/SEC14 domain-containing protein [Bizionia]OBX22488.1 hypothetical protein BAA08_08665 [Bizionia sp. APA-3]TYB74610.1 STAS/SEC14 domain-containing protein [Bizionia algoritergicola]